MKIKNKFRKSLKKWIKQRLYGFDLIHTNENGDNVKICRFIKGSFIDTFVDDDGKHVEILSLLNGNSTYIQMYSYLSNCNDWTDAFFIARNICQCRSGYHISFTSILKELRNN